MVKVVMKNSLGEVLSNPETIADEDLKNINRELETRKSENRYYIVSEEEADNLIMQDISTSGKNKDMTKLGSFLRGSKGFKNESLGPLLDKDLLIDITKQEIKEEDEKSDLLKRKRHFVILTNLDKKPLSKIFNMSEGERKELNSKLCLDLDSSRYVWCDENGIIDKNSWKRTFNMLIRQRNSNKLCEKEKIIEEFPATVKGTEEAFVNGKKVEITRGPGEVINISVPEEVKFYCLIEIHPNSLIPCWDINGKFSSREEVEVWLKENLGKKCRVICGKELDFDIKLRI